MTHANRVRASIACTLVLSTSGCSMIMPIESRAPVQRYKSAEYAWQALNVVDYGQTVHVSNSKRTDAQMDTWQRRNFTVDRHCYEEANPATRALIGARPSQSSVALSSLAYALGHYYVSTWLERRDTLNEFGEHNSPWYIANVVWHTVGLATKAVTVVNNHSIGLRVGGSGCKE